MGSHWEGQERGHGAPLGEEQQAEADHGEEEYACGDNAGRRRAGVSHSVHDYSSEQPTDKIGNGDDRKSWCILLNGERDIERLSLIPQSRSHGYLPGAGHSVGAYGPGPGATAG